MRLEFQNIVVRNTTLEDAKQLEIWWNDGKVMAHAGWPLGTGQTEAEIAAKIATDDDYNHRRLMIEYDSKAIGEMNYRNVGNNTAELGIKICDFSMQNKGLGKIILSMVIESLFLDFHFEKIVLDTNLNNKRAQHVYEQLGFKKVAVNIDNWKDQLGNLQSSVDYELIYSNFVNYKK